MIIYPDGPNINFVNSILEKDIIKRIPSDYSLNLLTLDQNKLENKDTRIKSNNDDIKVNNIQRELINLLNYETEQSFIQEKTEKEFQNKEEFNDKQDYSDINNETTDDLINENKESNAELSNEMDNNLYILKNKNNYNNINQMKIGQKNCDIKDNNKNKKNLDDNNNLECNINQNIYNNFNIPYVNFIYNIGTAGINNNYINNNIKNQDINSPININNFNNRFININPNIISNLEKQPNNINNNYNNSFNMNNIGNNELNYVNNDNEIFNNIIKNNNINNYYIGGNNNIIIFLYLLKIRNNNNHKKILNKIKNNSYENKYINMNLQEITNKLDIIATKKHGCKFLEHFLKSSENKSEIINKIFYPKLYWIKLYELSNDLFGNYFIQELIPELDSNNLISFTNLVINNLLNLCLNPHGTRVVQILINNIKDNKFGLLIIFKNALSNIMDKLINNLNGSFVLMHYAAQIRDNEIIYEFLNNNLVEIATNSYSCSALQKLIDIATNQQKVILFTNIINNSNNLVGNQCGLYVLQFIMNKNNYYINDAILNQIINKIIYLSKRKYSSNVVEKCLETCSPEKVRELIRIFNNEEIIRDLIKDIFGNYVIQKLLNVCPDEGIKNRILGYIALEFNNLKSLPFGPKLMNKIIMSYPQIRKNL